VSSRKPAQHVPEPTTPPAAHDTTDTAIAHAAKAAATAAPKRPKSAEEIVRLVLDKADAEGERHREGSASVERLFSVAGQVVTGKRNSLHPSSVTLLVFLHEAIPGVIERESQAIIQDKILVE